TDYGYHLIKVTDKLPAMGKVQVAHLYINVPRNIKNADSLKIYENKIKEAYSKLKDGAKFEDLVKDYSDDKGTASKGGLLPPFGVNRMVPEFIVAIAKLKEKGDISEPVKTMYGWHIIQLVEKKGIGSFDEKKAEIKSKIAKDNRAEKSKESLIARIKKDYKFTENKKAKEDFYKVVTDSVFFGKWKLDQAKGLNSLLFKLGDTSLYQNNFAEYISTHQFFREKQNLETYVNELYKNFIDEVAISYEDKNLENKYPEFKMLVQEYRDGIMLFDITDKKVWSKAVQDTIGLEKYYSNITEKYMWDKRLDASIYSGPNEKVMKQTLSLVKKADKKKYTDNDIYSKINKDKKDNIVIESSLFSKGDNHLIDSIQWAPAITPIFKKGQTYMIIHSRKVLDPQPKTLKEARGLITADYQNYLEQQWISELKRKYPVIINQEVFNTIK
ncbi:MAG: peptidylprolyl isomerase, partial [Bacteroidales bacterium]|nr:peptidylprolyl isomerase [Bacteroidales bacterium]